MIWQKSKSTGMVALAAELAGGACPEIYEQNAEDEKSQIVGKFRVAENIAEGSVEGTLVECAQQGADGCPVQVISLD